MHHFFIPPDWIHGDDVVLKDDIARQLVHVLRSQPGDRIVVLDDSGREFRVRLDVVRPSQVRGTITDSAVNTGEPPTRVTLYQGLLKGDKFEFVLQKGTELGIAAFVPMTCARSVPRPRVFHEGNSRLPRWRRIITEAAEQSRRGRIPALGDPVDFFSACDRIEGRALIPWEQETTKGLRSTLLNWKAEGCDSSSVDIFVGPEGGFTEEEVQYAGSKGIVAVSLGARVIRAETAGIATAAAVLYEYGELGG